MIECNCEFVFTDDNDENWEKHYDCCEIRLTEREKNGEFSQGKPRNKDGMILFQNKHIKKLKNDFIYHLDMGVTTHDLKSMFGDVKFVCMGGTASRMKLLAEIARKELGCDLPTGHEMTDLTASSHRYSMYKAGPFIAVNHGVGMSTLAVVLQEVIKLLIYCGAKDPIIIRVGTSGGIGVEPGTVVISHKGYEGMFNNSYTLPVLGKMTSMLAVLDKRLAQELQSTIKEEDGFKAIIANTMCSNDFYNGQGRLDGPFCDYDEEDKYDFLNKLYNIGIRNIEMEVSCFAALTYKAGIKAADVCVTLLNRFNGDQISVSKEEKHIWEQRPMILVIRYMQKYLKNIGRYPYSK